jgi:hypothetical protein
MRILVVICASILASGTLAANPSWQVFDAAYPQDFIDALSKTFQSKGIVRFWERAGAGRYVQDGNTKYPSYTLTEINCVKRIFRDLKWDYALEDQLTPEGIAARAKFMQSTLELQKGLPSAWDSIEPDKHSYARFNFVCDNALKQLAGTYFQ